MKATDKNKYNSDSTRDELDALRDRKAVKVGVAIKI